MKEDRIFELEDKMRTKVRDGGWRVNTEGQILRKDEGAEE